MRVSDSVLHKAVEAYHKAYGYSQLTHSQRPIILSAFGITNKQWIKYVQTKKLKVNSLTAEKLTKASILNSPHGYTLFKVMEARAKNK